MITIEAIKHELSGDWHDKPLRYRVTGPNAEIQKFSTKKDAERYSRIRRNSIDQMDAIRKF